MSITITIIGIITIAGINFQMSMTNNSQKNITLDKLNRIEQAINEYFLEHGQLPCPANIELSNTNSEYGVELRNNQSDECYTSPNLNENNNIIYGSIPTKTLGLTDDYGVDGWKNNIAYIIHKNYGKKSLFLSSGGDAIKIRNLNNNKITDKAIYFLFSPGLNKNGAFRNGIKNTINESLRDKNNAYKNNFNNLFIKDVATDDFDDIAIYKEKEEIILESDFEDIPCNLEDLKNIDSNWNYNSNANCPDKICQHGTEIVSSSNCSDNLISKNPNEINGDYRPIRKCLKYGKWSNIIYPCVEIDGCGVLNNSIIEDIDTSYLKKVVKGEEITLECTNNKTGYVTLKCDTDGNWKILGNCINKNNKI